MFIIRWQKLIYSYHRICEEI